MTKRQARRRADAAIPRRLWRISYAFRTRPDAEAALRHHGRAEHGFEGPAHGVVDLGHRHRHSKVDKARHAMLADTARHDAGEVRQVRLDVEADAVEADP